MMHPDGGDDGDESSAIRTFMLKGKDGSMKKVKKDADGNVLETDVVQKQSNWTSSDKLVLFRRQNEHFLGTHES